MSNGTIKPTYGIPKQIADKNSEPSLANGFRGLGSGSTNNGDSNFAGRQSAELRNKNDDGSAVTVSRETNPVKDGDQA